jgi:hypothetical protein
VVVPHVDSVAAAQAAEAGGTGRAREPAAARSPRRWRSRVPRPA